MGRYFPSKDIQTWMPPDLADDPGGGMSECQRQLDAEEAILAASRVQGYLTHNWFGPFLLGPAKRLGRGWC